MPIARFNLAFCLTLSFTCLLFAIPCFSHSVKQRSSPATVKAAPRIPTALEIYQRSLDADDNYSYRGRQITTSWSNGRALAVEVSHLKPEYRRLDYLSPDTMRGQILITDGKQQWIFDPRTREVLHRAMAPPEDLSADTDQNFRLLKSNYILSFLPATRTYTDRKTFVLSISRKANHHLARRLWVDAATDIVLKREIYSEDGKLSVTVAFTDINYYPKFTQGFFKLTAQGANGVKVTEQKPDKDMAVPLPNVPAQLGNHAIAPLALDGYRLVKASLVPSPAGNTILHLRYFDGLELMSLFEQPRMHTKLPTKVPRKMLPIQIGRYPGHISHDSHLITLNWDTSTLNLTLMAEVSQAEIQRLAGIIDSGH